MTKLTLSVAVGEYDRTRALTDGTVQIDGVAPVVMNLSPEEIFFRAFRAAEFDICELSLSSFCVKTAAGNCPVRRRAGLPVASVPAHRHLRAHRPHQGARRPQGQAGRRLRVPAHRQRVGAGPAGGRLRREALRHPLDPRRARGGRAGWRRSRSSCRPTCASRMRPWAPRSRPCWPQGAIDAFIGPRVPSCFERGHPDVGWLFPDPIAAASDYYARTGIFPIMHIVGVRRSLVDQHPWLPAAVLKAFEQAKSVALARLGDTSATKVTMPFVEEQLKRVRDLMGPDYWSYGVAANRKVLDTFLHHHHAQGLSSRRLVGR